MYKTYFSHLMNLYKICIRFSLLEDSTAKQANKRTNPLMRK